MSEEKSKWDKATQSWEHPDTVFPPNATTKKKQGRPRNNDLAKVDGSQDEDEILQNALSAIRRQHDAWEKDQERKYGVDTFRDDQGNLVRDAEGKIIMKMSERFAALLIRAEAADDVVAYPAGDPRGSFGSTNPEESFGWKYADSAAKYGAELSERDPRRTENNYVSTPAEIEEAQKVPEANHLDDAIGTAESL